MISVLFKIGPLTVHSFGLMVALGFLSSFAMMLLIAKRGLAGAIREDAIANLLVVIMFGGAFGARIAYVAEHWESEFAGRFFSEFFRFDKGGLMFYGGLIGAILAIGLFSYFRKINIFDILDLCAVVLPLGHAFGRIGCFLNGCCFGRLSDSPIAVCYPPRAPAWTSQLQEGLISSAASKSLPVLPSQLIEAGLNLALFAILATIVIRKKSHRCFASGLYLAGYASIRFFTETLRSDPRMQVGVLSIGQTISIGIFAAGVLLIAYSHIPSRKGQLKGE